jgi:hypothetical protein
LILSYKLIYIWHAKEAQSFMLKFIMCMTDGNLYPTSINTFRILVLGVD